MKIRESIPKPLPVKIIVLQGFGWVTIRFHSNIPDTHSEATLAYVESDTFEWEKERPSLSQR